MHEENVFSFRYAKFNGLDFVKLIKNWLSFC
jgi:hypothetical protein